MTNAKLQPVAYIEIQVKLDDSRIPVEAQINGRPADIELNIVTAELDLIAAVQTLVPD